VFDDIILCLVLEENKDIDADVQQQEEEGGGEKEEEEE